MNFDNKIVYEDLPMTITVKELSFILRLSLNKTYELCNRSDFPSCRVGKRIIIPKAALIKWMENPNYLKELA
jgi:excisionase family DNA binding protein